MKQRTHTKPGRTSTALATFGVAAALASGLLTPAARAAYGTWIVDGTGNWSATANWSGGIVADGADNIADFSTVNITANRTVTLDSNRTLGGLIFGDTVTLSHDWILQSSTLTLQTTSGTPTITVNNRTATINTILTGNQGFTKTGTGTLVLSGNNIGNGFAGLTTVSAGILRLTHSNAVGNVDLGASGTLNFDNTGLTFAGDITGSGKVSKTNSSSTLTLTGNNTFTGGMTLGDGTLALGAGTNNGIGTGTFALSGGTLRSADNNARTITNTLSFGSNAVAFGATQGATDGLGNLTFTDSGTRSIGGSKNWTVNNSTTVTFNNAFNGNSGWGINKQGNGTLVFNGGIVATNSINVVVTAGTLFLNGSTNSYTGTTTVNGGKLVINGSKTGANLVTVNNGGTLAGTGTVNGNMTVNAGGTLAPGNSIGTINTSTLNLAGTLAVELGRNAGTPTNDRTNVVGTVTLNDGADLALTLSGNNPEAGDVFYLISNDGSDSISGIFTKLNGATTDLSEGSLFTWNSQQWQITYLADYSSGFTGGNDLAIQVVPEPAMLSLLGLGGLALLRRRKNS